MRTIKFRAWDAKNKMMIFPEYGNWISFDGITYEEANKRYNTPNTELERSYDLEVLQFTGIKDRNGEGVDVYEGDIIGRTSFFDKVIVWHNCGFYTYSANNPERLFPLEHLDEFDVVIGNIYQHPELLK